MGRKIVLALALLFWMVAAALYLTAMLTDSWSRIEIPAISLLDTSDVSVQTNGLFKTCVNVFFGITCTNQGWNPDEVPTAIFIPRIIMLAAGALVALGLLFGIVGLCASQSCPVITEGVLGIVGGLLVFAACGTYTALNISNNQLVDAFTDNTFQYSFYLAWVSGLMFIIAGVCDIIAGKSQSHY
ncbi:uncharacterized protein LOC143461773 [Clavelina lepadiformis]|uniref:Uncharacterized protein n=1 Tax=Clavelina lepadiformis TaxID=159417 RepID=A0ABP0FVX1_CLALP